MLKSITVSFIAVFTLTAASSAAMPGEISRIGFTSFGAARIGMTRRALEVALNDKLLGDNPESGTESCEYVTPSKGQPGVSFMLLDNKLARIDVWSTKVQTISGARVGAPQENVLALYHGRISVTPHFYTAPDGAYLTLLSSDKKHGIRFETDHGKVIKYYAGTSEAIQFVEGCQ